MHFALFISAIGIVDLLLSTAPAVGYTTLSISVLGGSFFFLTTLLPVFVPDAPFRSPVSKFLSGMKRRFHLPRYYPSVRKEETTKTKELDDYIEQSQGKESDENSIVRTQIYLDLDIICHLLQTADKSTERWLLDLCFQKIPHLKRLEERDPSAFHSRGIIIASYNFLIQGCINKKAGLINPDRLLRAKELCEFVSWYLCLPQTRDEREIISQNFDKNGDSTLLATLLAKNEGYPNIIAALTALGHLKHFRNPGPRHKCSVCSNEVSAIASDLAGDQSPERQDGKMRRLLSLLIMRTDCMLLWQNSGSVGAESVTDECQESRPAIQQALRQSSITEKDKKLWMQALSEKEIRASLSLKEVWFTPLSMILNELHPTRRAAFRPGGNVSPGPVTNVPNSPGHATGITPIAIPNILLSRPSVGSNSNPQ